jgi:hypothetical protein
MNNKALNSEVLEAFTLMHGSASDVAYQGFTFPVGGDSNIVIGVAQLPDVPSLGITSYIATCKSAAVNAEHVHVITGARGDTDLSLCLASFIAGFELNGGVPRKGDSYEGVFELDDRPLKYSDAVLVEPFPFILSDKFPGQLLYLMPITPDDRLVLERHGIDMFESRQISSRRDVFSIV